MKIVNKIINIKDFIHYTYDEELNIYKCRATSTVPAIYQIKDLLKIINILEDNNIDYSIDKNQNIIIIKKANTLYDYS